jgi:hypothetical protein
MKPLFVEFMADLRKVAVKAKRYEIYNVKLPNQDAETARAEFEAEAKSFMSRYAIAEEDVRSFAFHIAETCELGLVA